MVVNPAFLFFVDVAFVSRWTVEVSPGDGRGERTEGGSLADGGGDERGEEEALWAVLLVLLCLSLVLQLSYITRTTIGGAGAGANAGANAGAGGGQLVLDGGAKSAVHCGRLVVRLCEN